eukprot:jgi/Mesvir1/21379/Mv20863-RA.1
MSGPHYMTATAARSGRLDMQEEAGEGLSTLVGRSLAASAVLEVAYDEEAEVTQAWFAIPALEGACDEDAIAASETKDPVAGKPIDPGFQPTTEVLLRNREEPPENWPEDIEWQRLEGELYLGQSLSTTGGKLQLQSGDIQRGLLDNMWLLGAMSVLTSRQDMLLDLFVSDELKDRGVYTFKFFKNAEWRQVAVDDMLPLNQEDSGPLFARSTVPGELWPSLLEKAYAKLHGSYHALEGGSVVDALVDLTGGVAFKWRLSDPKVVEEVQSGSLWAKLLQYFKWGHLLACKYSTKGIKEDELVDDGVLHDHVYTIIDVKEVSSGAQLLRLRNPWGKMEWTGPWSDTSDEWTRSENFGLQRELNYEFSDDGTFWMALADFTRVFNKVYVCQLFQGANWKKHEFKGSWVNSTAGGGPEFRGQMSGTWCNNPQYVLRAKRNCQVFLSLSQRDVRAVERARRTKEERRCHIGLCVLKGGSGGRKWLRVDNEVVEEVPLSNQREICLTLKAQAGKTYIIVPYNNLPGQEGPYFLRMYSDTSLDVSRLPSSMELVVAGEWKEHTAGGRRFHTTWASNPQYMLAVGACTAAMIVLRRTSAPPHEHEKIPYDPQEAIGLCLTRPSKERAGLGRRMVIEDEKDVLAESEFVSMWEAVLHLTLTPEAPYVLSPSTVKPGVISPFEISVYSDNPVEIATFAETKTVALTGEWSKDLCGGCDLNPGWDKNPRFLLTINAPGRYRVTLRRPPSYWKRGTSLDNMFGFYILQSSRADGRVKMDRKLVKYETSFVPMNEVTEEYNLEMDPQPIYVIMPCTYAAGKTGKFNIMVTSDCDFTFVAMSVAV